MENFIFNKHNVCMNPEQVFFAGDFKTGEIEIKVAYHSESGKWCAATRWQVSGCMEGGSSPCSPTVSHETRQQAIQEEIKYVVSKILNKFPAKIHTAFNQFRVSVGHVRAGDQMALF